MDQTAMLVAAISALWVALMGLARILWLLILRILDEKNAEIESLKGEARATVAAKDEELREWRKQAYLVAAQRPPVTPGGE